MSQSNERARRRARQAFDAAAHAQDVPIVEKSRAAITDLLAVWPDGDSTVDLPKMDDHWVRAGVIWVLTNHAVQTAKAVLLLDNNAMYAQAAPLARLIYECGATAAWTAKTDYAGHALVAQAEYARALLIEDLAKMAGETAPPESDRKGEWEEHRLNGMKFEQRFRELDGGLWMQGWYRMLSAWSHGNGSLFQTWLTSVKVTSSTPHGYGFLDENEFQYRNVVMALTAVMLNMALLARDEVTDGHPFQQRLAELETKHGLRGDLFTFEDKDEEPA